MSTPPAAAGPAPRGRRGHWSVLLALLGLAFAVAAIAVFAAVPKTAPDALRTASTLVFMAALVAVPLGHVVRFGMAISALFRPNDRRVLAVIGMVLNGVFVLGMLVFMYGFFGAMGSFR